MYAFHVAGQSGLDDKMLHTYAFLCLTNTSESAEKPFVHLSHHEVVPRSSLAWVPLLGERGSTLECLESVAWRLVVVEHFV